jgi:hypothetical protein
MRSRAHSVQIPKQDWVGGGDREMKRIYRLTAEVLETELHKAESHGRFAERYPLIRDIAHCLALSFGSADQNFQAEEFAKACGMPEIAR